MLINHLADYVAEKAWKSKRECFMGDRQNLMNYLKWAFSEGYLFYSLGENGFSGLGVAYPIEGPYDYTIDSIAPKYLDNVDEGACELIVMDMFAETRQDRQNLIGQFTKRFPKWSEQKKWKYRGGEVTVLQNKYINKLLKI